MDIKALRNLSYGMYVIGSRQGERLNGQIAHRVFQVSVDPPTIAISINPQNLTHDYIQESGRFTVSVLEQGTPMRLIRKFGYKSGREIDKYENTEYELSPQGIPYLTRHSLAFLEAQVCGKISVSGNMLFLATVTESQQLSEGQPMPFSFRYLQKPDPNLPRPQTGDGTTDRNGRFECMVCGFIYDPAEGDPEFGVPPGTLFDDLPEDWTCPLCDAVRESFQPFSDKPREHIHKEYANRQLIVHWFPQQCSHSAKCLKNAPGVFNKEQRPWINIDADDAGKIIQTIDLCPSGALKYSLPPGSMVEPESAQGPGWLEYEKAHQPSVRLRVIPRGPLLVEGPVSLADPQQSRETEGSRFALCRCGMTDNPPFCNNNHARR